MAKNHTEVEVLDERVCDYCWHTERVRELALYDGKTTQGPWANMCQTHFEAYGIGLGLGRGQKLLYPTI